MWKGKRRVTAVLAGVLVMALALCACGGANGGKQEKEEKNTPKSDGTYYVPESMEKTGKDGIGFPGADGFGKEATGGRGGKVYEVTNLNDSGEGSLREACEAEGARTVVFKVSGTINLESSLTIKNGDITIAGQTAPGDGICLANFGMIITKAENVIVRYIRVRPGSTGAALAVAKGGEKPEPDAIWIEAGKNVILDHCSTSWAVDETLSVSPSGEGNSYENVSDNISVQWCIVSESLKQASFIGTRHGMGSLIRGAQGSKVTFHHNLYASHSSRMPMCGNYMEEDKDDGNFQFEFINNVVYNWTSKSSGKCADADEKGEKLHITYVNYINNVFKAGPFSEENYAFSEACMGNHMYIAGNSMNGEIPEDQKSLVLFEKDVLEEKNNPYYVKSGLVLDIDKYFLSKPFDFSRMTEIQPAGEVEEGVLAGVGASLSRDSVDTAIIKSYQDGTGEYVNNPTESLGWEGPELPEEYKKTENAQQYYDFFQENYPELKSFEGYVDSDKDGMSDEWEDFMGLDKDDASDGAKLYGKTDYTNLEVFLQYLIENPEKAKK